MTSYIEEQLEHAVEQAEKKRKAQQEKDFLEMANAVEKYMQNYCHPHNTIIATLSGIEVVEGIKAKGFEVLD